MMAEYVLMAERKGNSDGKIMFGLFLLVRSSLLNQRQGASLVNTLSAIDNSNLIVFVN